MRLFPKLLITIISIVLISSLLGGFLFYWRIDRAFDVFLNQQNLLLGQSSLVDKALFVYRVLSEAPEHQDLQNTFRTTILVSILLSLALALVSAILLSFVLLKPLLSPLHELKAEIEQLKLGETGKPMKFTNDKEIDQILAVFESLRQDLIRTESLRQEALGDAIHEINTPLQTIIGTLDGIEDEIYQIKDKLPLLRESTNEIQHLIEDMRVYSAAKARLLNWEEIKLEDFFQELCTIYGGEARRRNLTLCHKLEKPITVRADRDMLRHIIGNLLKNSLTYTDKGSIVLGAHEIENSTELTVKDTGCGIPPDEISFIFDRFYRGTTTRASASGSGLGLAIVKEYVNRLGWNLEVKSTVGKGTLFTITT